MRRSPLLITAGVLVLTVTAVVAVKFVRTYETPASAGRAPVTAEPSGDAIDPVWNPVNDDAHRNTSPPQLHLTPH